MYLHYAFDLWADRWRRREATGNVVIVRYADDIVVGFEHEADAVRFREALASRLASFSLTLHPDKTRLIQFGRHAAVDVGHELGRVEHRSCTQRVPRQGGGTLETLAPAAQPAGLHHLGADEKARLRLVAETTYPASMAE